jgi:FMN reductase
VGHQLSQRGILVERLLIRDLSPQALLLADFGHPSVISAIAKVAHADAIVVATPVYKAAYSGVLKVLLDLLPQTALKDKTVLPLATDAQVILTPEDAYVIQPEIADRLDQAVNTLILDGLRLPPATAGFEPIAFSRVRCSV